MGTASENLKILAGFIVKYLALQNDDIPLMAKYITQNLDWLSFSYQQLKLGTHAVGKRFQRSNSADN